jgi:hypothetical protein
MAGITLSGWHLAGALAVILVAMYLIAVALYGGATR